MMPPKGNIFQAVCILHLEQWAWRAISPHPRGDARHAPHQASINP
jgi:hypothetical protein